MKIVVGSFRRGTLLRVVVSIFVSSVVDIRARKIEVIIVVSKVYC